MIRPRLLFQSAALGFVAFLLAQVYGAYTASNTVLASQIGRSSTSITANDLKPPECTMTVTSIASGTGTFNATAQFQLVVGSSAQDIVTLQKNDCFVGGGPTSGSTDKVTGPAPGPTNGDQCVVTAAATVIRCTIVATRP